MLSTPAIRCLLLAFCQVSALLLYTVCVTPVVCRAAALWSEVAPGVLRTSTTITNTVGYPETLWIYEPKYHSAPKLPCIFIAPAGTSLMSGNALGAGDMPEHIPYVQAGYVVVVYSLDGDVSDADHMSDLQYAAALQAFADAHFGLTDSQAALNYALKHIPAVDSKRCYTAGHSSAGTVSLLFAEHEPRLAGCIAYAPAADAEYQIAHQNPKVYEQLCDRIDNYAARLHRASPSASPATLRCPAFIFHADDDSIVNTGEVQRFVAALKQTNSSVTYITVPTGDHYDSMIQQGIPDAL